MHPRCTPPRLVAPVEVDAGEGTPTRGEAAGPRWRRAGPGLYVPAAIARTPEQRAFEQWWRIPESFVTGWAACRMHGAAYLDGVSPSGAELPVPLVVAPTQSPRPAGARILRQPLDRRHRTVLRGMALTTADRAVLDLARLTDDPDEAIVAVDMAYAAGITLPEHVEQARALATSWRARRTADVLSRASVRSCSPPESRLRLVCHALGWRPSVNVEVFAADGRFLARPDLFVEELGMAIEYDGALHRDRSRHQHDNRRLHLLRQAGVEVVTIVGGGVVTREARAEARQMLLDGARLASRPRDQSWTLTAPANARLWVPAVDHLRARSRM